MSIKDDLASKNDLDRVVIGATLGNLALGRFGAIIGAGVGYLIKSEEVPVESTDTNEQPSS